MSLKSIPLEATTVAPFRLLSLRPPSRLANRRCCEGCATPLPAGRTSPGNRDRRRGGRTACPNAALSDGLQEDTSRLWAAAELRAEDSVRSGHCGGGARATCNCGKGACRCSSLCEVRVEETGQGFQWRLEND